MVKHYAKEKPITRLVQVTIPRDAYILLGKLIQRRVEQDTAPSKATKSMVISEAITWLAMHEGIEFDMGGKDEKPKEPKNKPFELVSAT